MKYPYRLFAIILAGLSPATGAHAASAPGLWNMSIQIGGGGMPAMPAMPPEVMAQMRSMGIQIPGLGGAPMERQVCISPEQAARAEMPSPNSDCRVQNQRANGRTITGDIVCTGREINGTGTFEVIYDSDTHFTQKVSMRSAVEGRQVDMTIDVDGRHINANCGNVRPDGP